MSNKGLAIIAIPTIICILFGGLVMSDNLPQDILTYINYIGDNVADISLFGGYSFNGGFAEASKALLYVLTLPLRLLWALFQLIFYTSRYWGFVAQ